MVQRLYTAIYVIYVWMLSFKLSKYVLSEKNDRCFMILSVFFLGRFHSFSQRILLNENKTWTKRRDVIFLPFSAIIIRIHFVLEHLILSIIVLLRSECCFCIVLFGLIDCLDAWHLRMYNFINVFSPWACLHDWSKCLKRFSRRKSHTKNQQIRITLFRK